MKVLWIAAMAAWVAMPVEAENLNYANCISMLDTAIKMESTVDQSFGVQAKMLNALASKAPVKAALEANIKARAENGATMKAYIDTLAVACEALR